MVSSVWSCRWTLAGFVLIVTGNMLRDSRSYTMETMTRFSDAAWQFTMPVVVNNSTTTEWWPSAADAASNATVSSSIGSTAAPAPTIIRGSTPKPNGRDNDTVLARASWAYNNTTSFTSKDYDVVYLWRKPPSFTVFDFNPYHQFCRWYLGSNPRRIEIQRKEGWREQKSSGVINARNDRGKKPRRILIELQLDCYRIMKESPFGTGNWVQMLLLMRLAAAGTAQSSSNIMEVVDLKLVCIDDPQQEGSKSLVLPWIMGNFSAEETLQVLSRYWGQHKLDLKCYTSGWNSLPLGWVIPLMQQDLRRMAVELVGVPTDPEHPAHKWLLQQQKDQSPNATLSAVHQHASPLIPNVTLDEVAIHFRCGDIMLSEEVYFRFLKYHEFSSRIDPTTTSIGILTQPFGKGANFHNETTLGEEADHDQARARDGGNPFRDFLCRRVLLSFQEHLQSKFPNATVSIHNGPQETVALAYARMIMAKKQAFVFPDSSFSIYPVLGTFGTPVLFYPTKSPYYEYGATKNWFLRGFRYTVFRQHNDFAKAQWMDVSAENSLFSIETLHMSKMHGNDHQGQMRAAKDILEWFTNETLVKPRFPQIPTFPG